MDVLGRELDPAEARSLEERLALADDPDRSGKLCIAEIALDRKRRPQVYRELLAHYLESGDPRRHVQIAGRLLPEHVTPALRLPFAYLLVAPLPSPPVQLEERAAQALGRIGDPSSLEILVLAFRSTCRPGIQIQEVASRQGWILAGLSARAEPERLEPLLDCLSMSAEQRRQAGQGAPYDMQALFERDLRLLEEAGAPEAAAWRAVLAQAPREGWSRDRQAIADRLAAALAPARDR